MSEEEYHGAGRRRLHRGHAVPGNLRSRAVRAGSPLGTEARLRIRLDAPARALAGGIRVAGLGALLGLSDPLFDTLCLFRHASYLRRKFWKAGVSISFPRLRPEPGGYSPEFPVDENLLARIIFAFRICLPDVPLRALDSREPPVPGRHGRGGHFEDERRQPHHGRRL